MVKVNILVHPEKQVVTFGVVLIPCQFNATGSTQPSGDEAFCARSYSLPSWQIGYPGDVVRVNAYIGGGAGTVAQFSVWLDGI
jgi:hypothetical protein